MRKKKEGNRERALQGNEKRLANLAKCFQMKKESK